MDNKTNNNRNRWQQRAGHNTKGIRIKVCPPLRYRSESNVATTTKLQSLRYR